MANTTHEHAGNEEQRRALQLDLTTPRCEACHFEEGAVALGQEIELEPVALPGGKMALICQLCMTLCKGFGGLEAAAKHFRPLPPETRAANDARLNQNG